uniref:Uncharacterized protein n=1 Tax=Toxoplasma gondii (strain ATCC 50861 / VEG) TaxID=432359 RepID=A0A0F7V983_TOXGV|nr:TPA: hypothetical protein BN1205_094255 [Toxoplasma gondii VEG]
MPMDPHTAVELVLKLWQPLPPASSLLENSKSVRQELRELLATRKQRSETLSTPTPSPSDSECRAFLFECLSAPLPAEEQCGEVPSGFVSAVSEDSSWDRKNNEATLCTSVPATSLAVSKTTEPNPFSFTAGLRHEGSPSTSGNETRPRRARRMHNPTPEGLVPPVACGGEFTVTGGGGNAIQTRPAPTVSSAGSPMRKFGIHQAGGSLLIGVEAAVNAPPIRGDKPHGNKAGSNGRPSHVHDTLASSSACHRHLQLLRSGETFSPAQKSVRFCHAETVSGDRLAFRFDAKAPCNNKGVPTNGRGAKGSSPRQSFLEKEQSFFPPSVANVAVQEKCVRLSLFSNRKYHGHENPLIQEANKCCEEVHASDTTEAYDGVVETSYSAMKTRSGRQVKLNHARFPGLRTSGELVPA